MRQDGDPQSGVVLRHCSVSACVYAQMFKCACAWLQPHYADIVSLFLSLVPLMNNDLIVDGGVKCQLSVCLDVTCHFDRSVFPPLF